jgi:ribosomal protein S18 acetylase RimI-like enzyme
MGCAGQHGPIAQEINLMDVKTAVSADVPAIAALWREGWMQGHGAAAPKSLTEQRTADEFLTRTKAHLQQTQVAWIDGQMAGFFMIEADELYQFYVAPNFQGSGVARALMAEAEAALGDGLKWLSCLVGNKRAARFYEKSGWVLAATVPYEVETEEGPQVINAWRFEKHLGAAR